MPAHRFHSFHLGFLRYFSLFHLHTMIDMLITADSDLRISTYSVLTLGGLGMLIVERSLAAPGHPEFGILVGFDQAPTPTGDK